MIDPDLYNRVDGKYGKGTLDTQVKCFNCGRIQTLREMRDKAVLNSSDEELSPYGLRLKRRLEKVTNEKNFRGV